MRKTIARTTAAGLIAAGVLGIASGTASASTAASAQGVTCPAQVPSYATVEDYVNAWNTSGACLGGGAAGLVSSAWVAAIPAFGHAHFG